jgi:NAD(P)-dependent dehydrogenase (short-subunit alcohol dehydrogenase family)
MVSQAAPPASPEPSRICAGSCGSSYSGRGVRVNAIAPGPILSGPIVSAPPQAREHVAATVPVGRMGRPEEVAAAAVWLCSARSDFVTGATLAIDGGVTAG